MAARRATAELSNRNNGSWLIPAVRATCPLRPNYLQIPTFEIESLLYRIFVSCTPGAEAQEAVPFVRGKTSRSKDGRLISFYGRAVGTDDHAPKGIRHDHLVGAKGIFNALALWTPGGRKVRRPGRH